MSLADETRGKARMDWSASRMEPIDTSFGLFPWQHVPLPLPRTSTPLSPPFYISTIAREMNIFYLSLRLYLYTCVLLSVFGCTMSIPLNSKARNCSVSLPCGPFQGTGPRHRFQLFCFLANRNLLRF